MGFHLWDRGVSRRIAQIAPTCLHEGTVQYFWFRRVAKCVVTSFAYICVHELGHVIHALMAGGHVTNVVMFSATPHVTIVSSFNRPQDAMTAASGTALSVLAWLIFMLTRNRSKHVLVMHVTSMFALTELLGWSLSALLYHYGTPADDAGMFLEASGDPPLLVASICAAFLALAGALYFRETSIATTSTPDPGELPSALVASRS